MYSLTLSNLDLEVTTSFGGDGVVGHGTFTGNSSSITIPKNSKKEVSVVYNFDTTTEETNLAKQACFSASGLKYVTSGTVCFCSSKFSLIVFVNQYFLFHVD